jgi:hypothetical protein
MCIALQMLRTPVAVSLLATALSVVCGTALAQQPGWTTPFYNGYPAATYPQAIYPQMTYPAAPYAAPNGPNLAYGGYAVAAPAGPAMQPPGRPLAAPGRGPLARLVRNTNTSDGSPPFALADQNGMIQRFVEPVPGIDLGPFLGEIVVVRRDSGRTLLATQLELPPRPMLPMVGDIHGASGAYHAAPTPRRSAAEDFASGDASPSASVRPVRFVDHDDATVELIDDEQDAIKQNGAISRERSTMITSPMAGSSSTKMFGSRATEEIPHGAFLPGESNYDGPMMSGPMFPDALAGEFIQGDIGYGEACPQCGRRHGVIGCDPTFVEGAHRPKSRKQNHLPCGPLYGDVQLNFLRIHLMEGSVGKLSERYELSPRFTIGFDGNGSIGGRVRYWIYDRETPVLSGGQIGVEFNVIDIEATHRFQVGRSDLIVAAGFRWAGIDISDVDGDGTSTDLIGLTLAADAHTPLCDYHGGQLAWVYGGRLSVLGGDWNGSSNNDLVSGELQDDNVLVESIFVGVQYAMLYRECNVVARLAFEVQNWHSDVLSQNAGADSLGFLGPGVHIGATF